KRINLKNPKIDILVLAPSVQLSPPLELQPSINNIFLSQNVFFLGFPFGMNIEAKALNNFFPMPFVKKGIVSAMAFENKEEKILYVDGYNNPGFSGGPIVYLDLNEKKLKVAAVVSGYRNQLADIYDKDKATALKAVTNSGLLFGYTIDAAIDAIKDNPIGAEIMSK
ncbi:MAG: trypsin-like peptidase domain-containing protein, partial [Syntrophaceae bacterium]|nr:trypsin-like peptidase domain-containing protein [Syntrophaceae bacterium]